MNRSKISALVCALCLLAVLPVRALGDGFGTYIQPEGVNVCVQDDLRYFDAPTGLEAMYALMGGSGSQADVYLFLMPNGLEVISVARKDAVGTVQTLTEAWPKIQAALAEEASVQAVENSAMTEERAFGYDAVRITAALLLTGDVPVQAEGTAFFRDGDLLEVWTLCPDAAFCQSSGLPLAQLEEDQAAGKRLMDSFDFGGSAAPEAVLVENAVAYQDPAGAFSLMIPAKTVVVTKETDEAAVAACRAKYADGSQGDGRVFDEWLQDVADFQCTLMLLPELGLSWQLSCNDNENFRNADLNTFYRISEPVRASLEERFGSARTLADGGSAVLSGLEHAKLVYWLRADQTDVALEVYAITDGDGLLRELDLYTMMDMTADKDRQEAVLQMLRDTLTYSVPPVPPETPSAEPAAD